MMHSRLAPLIGATVVLGAMALLTVFTPREPVSHEAPGTAAFASAVAFAPGLGARSGVDLDVAPIEAAVMSGWGGDWIAKLSSGDCKGIASGDRSWCDTNDCKGIASGDRSWCDSNDCKGVAAKDRSWCQTSLCKGWASGDRTWCDTNDCKGVASKDRSWCDSAQCKAIASGDRSWCP